MPQVISEQCEFNETINVKCEKIELKWWWFFDPKRMMSCFMNNSTELAFPDSFLKAPHDETVAGMEFSKNKKISFLPFNIHKSFPKLIVISAMSCSVKALYKQNFQNLTMLKQLDLHTNLIETVEREVLQDLVALVYLDLSKWKIFF